MFFKDKILQEEDLKLKIGFFHLSSCSGCQVAFLDMFEKVVEFLDTVELVYSNLLTRKKEIPSLDVAFVEGALCVEESSHLRLIKEINEKTKLIVSVGACASFGGIRRLSCGNQMPQPQHASFVPLTEIELIRNKLKYAIPGCPPNPHNFLSTVLYFLTFKKLPPTDKFGRPLFAYGRKVHDHCERRPHFDEGRYAEQFGDVGHRLGFCLYKVGCKGPETYSNCPVIRFNDVEVWPVSVGNGCYGCTEPNFWDTMTPFHKRLPNVKIPGGKGIQASATEIGKAALGVTAAAVAIHAGVGIAKRLATGSKSEE